ncbi:hypothetical protein [Sulfurimonas sp.]|uniref:hypothetical protein n=1 Tax=Sulfurimonas sp. TaxID=2022749 RepID=UPI0035673E20
MKRITILIGNAEQVIREYVNESGLIDRLVSDNEFSMLHQICASLDTIGDTSLAMDSYVKLDFPLDIGQKYIFIYGVLQVLFVQQDAVKNLLASLNVDYRRNEKLKKIRTIRNNAIGHPTLREEIKTKKPLSYHYITRCTISKDKVTLHNNYVKEDEEEFIDIDVINLIHEQDKILSEDLYNAYKIIV